MGRFLSVDPVNDSAALSKPQSWNRYSYAANGPIVNHDPDGRETEVFFVAGSNPFVASMERLVMLRSLQAGRDASEAQIGEEVPVGPFHRLEGMNLSDTI